MMKYLNKIIVLFFFTLGFISCEENENFEILPAPEKFGIVSPSSGTVIVLNDINLSNQALFLAWDDSSGQGTTYSIEVAKTGTDFSNPKTMGSSDSTDFSMTVDELNSFLVNVLELEADEAASIDIRITGSTMVTNPISVIITPYKVEFTEFYLVGSLTNWTPSEALQMTNIGFNLFEITIDLADGDEFKFLPTNGGWDGDWGKDPNNDGMLVVDDEQNLGGYGAGKFKVSVDLNTFTYVVEEVISPNTLYLVGSLTGWNPATSLPFNLSGDNLFTIVIDLPGGAEFKFLPSNTGWDGDWGVDSNNPGSIIQDGESNVSGYDAGTYLVTVDFNSLTYKLASIDNLFLVGSLTGWDPGTSVPLGEAGLGIFSTIIDLPDGAEFKFLPTNTGWDGDWGEDGNNAGSIVQDGENNLGGYGAGKHVIAVNFNTLKFTVSSVSEIPVNLYMVGSFRGWSNDGDNPQFTETSSGVFEITQSLSAGDEFKFVPVAGDWGNDWGENQDSSGVLEQNNEKNVSVSVGGDYKITIDFNNGSLSVVLQ